jgi:hypothetical protein
MLKVSGVRCQVSAEPLAGKAAGRIEEEIAFVVKADAG